MLLDKFQPDYDFNEVHSLRARASAADAFESVKEITAREIAFVMRFLLCRRSLPERMAGREEMVFSGREPLLAQMVR